MRNLTSILIGLLLTASAFAGIGAPPYNPANVAITGGTATFTAAAGAKSGLQIGAGSTANQGWVLGNLASGISGFWSSGVTPSTANYSLANDTSTLHVNHPTQITTKINNIAVLTQTSTIATFAGDVTIPSGTIGGTSVAQVAAAYSTAQLALTGRKLFASSTAAQTGFATETCVTGTSIFLDTPVVGTRYRVKIAATKSAAGTAAPVVSVKFDTTSCAAGIANVSFTLPAQTAAADSATFEIDVVYRSVGASAVYVAALKVNHKLASTGFINGQAAYADLAVSPTFDSNVSVNRYMYITINGGASAAWTVESAEAIEEKI